LAENRGSLEGVRERGFKNVPCAHAALRWNKFDDLKQREKTVE